MNRRILIQMSAPAVIIGLALFGACLASVWSINLLQRKQSEIITRNVASLEAAQELEINVRQLRFYTIVYMMDPKPERQRAIEGAHKGFEDALERAEQSTYLDQEKTIIAKLKREYDRYLGDLAAADLVHGNQSTDVVGFQITAGRGQAHRQVNLDPQAEFVDWIDAHPVRHLVDPCQELVELNKRDMEKTVRESKEVGQQARTTMLLLGIFGPISGLIAGYGIARGVSRSIARLNVRLQAVREQLDQEVASVRLAAEGNLQDLDRQLDRVVERVREVVERMQQQQREIVRAEQLAGVGQLAASVAHEIRNPLTAIKLLVGAALRPANGQTLSQEDLQVMHREIGRLEQTVQTLLDFARPPQVDRQTADIRAIVGQAVDLVRTRASQQNVLVAVRQPESPVLASVDRSQLCTVFVNLFLNALDAMPRGGQIDVAVATPAAHEVRVTVCDTGPGIDEGIQPRLFTPFATTKETGTGLGLSISRRVLRQHGGELSAHNLATGGASFTMVLPAELRDGPARLEALRTAN